MSHWDPERWVTPFAKFVRNYGAEKLAKELDVTRSAIYNWIRGDNFPTPPKAKRMVELAARVGLPLTLEQIFSHAQTDKAVGA